MKDSTKEFGYTVKSNVNNNKAGYYSVVIIASDKNGNSSQKDYEVNVKAKPKPKITSDNSDKQSTIQSNNSAASNVSPAQPSTTNTSNSQAKPTTTQQPAPVETPPAVEPIGNTVYIAGSGKGTKYHNNPNCSNMKNPVEVTLSKAQASGYTAYKKCY